MAANDSSPTIHSVQLLQVFRATLALSWIYHGIFPKLLSIAPMERAITATLGFDEKSSMFITLGAGVAEVIFGVLLFVFYRCNWLIKLNILALIGLLLYIAFFIPNYLFEAFNPVTTNLPLIVISLALLTEVQKHPAQTLAVHHPWSARISSSMNKKKR